MRTGAKVAPSDVLSVFVKVGVAESALVYR